MSGGQVLVVDDEAPARERLAELVNTLDDWEVVGSAATGREAVEFCERRPVDVVLLDIRMPDMGGIEAAQHLAKLETPPSVIFTTAYDEYAIEAFDAEAVGYLLKPVRSRKLAPALERAQRLAGQRASALQRASGGAPRQHLSVRVGDSIRLIPLADILFLEADQKYVTIHHTSGEDLTDESLKSLEDEFSQDFLRLHRSFLAALTAIEGIRRDSEGRHWVQLRSTERELPVSRRQAGDIKRRLRGG